MRKEFVGTETIRPSNRTMGMGPKYGKFAGHDIGRFGRDRCHPFV